jgi:CheY-like chemotaxis protein
MKIVTDEAETNAFLCNMRNGFVDQLGWRQWHALEITGQPALKRAQQGEITTYMSEAMSAYEGNIFWPESSVLIIFQKPDFFDVKKFADALPKQLRVPGVSCQVFSVSADQEQVEAMIKRHQKRTLTCKKLANSYSQLKEMMPNIDTLLEERKVFIKNRGVHTKPSIMVVDDDEMTLLLVQHAFGKDYSIVTAQTGVEAIEKHIHTVPDIIFLDIGLPDVDGLTLLNYMRLYDAESQIVMFSADSELVTRFEALAHGARGFAAKPFNRQLFTDYISRWRDAAR